MRTEFPVDAAETGERSAPLVAADRLRRFDVVALVGLTVLGVWDRLQVLPTSGLWHDDAWEALAANNAPWGRLFDFSATHLGYTAALKFTSTLGIDSGVGLALTSLPFGLAGAAIIYLMCVRAGMHRLVAVALGAAVVANTLHIEYSGRIKPYALEFALAGLLAILVNSRWRSLWTPGFTLGWGVAALTVGLISPFTMLLVGAASATAIVVEPGQWRRRVPALVIPLAVHIAANLRLRESYSTGQLRAVWETSAFEEVDGFIDASWNPFVMFGELVQHARRQVNAYPGGDGAVEVILVGLVVLGLGLGVRRRDTAAVFFSICLVGAMVGSSLDLFPFGAARGHWSRTGLWLMPAVAYGIGKILTEIVAVGSSDSRDQVLSRSRRWAGMVGIAGAVILAAGVVVSGVRGAEGYRAPGFASAVDFIESGRDGRDLVVISPGGSIYEYPAAAERPIVLVNDPSTLAGFDVAYPGEGDVVFWNSSAGRVASGSPPLADALTEDVYVLAATHGVFPDLDESLWTVLRDLGCTEVGSSEQDDGDFPQSFHWSCPRG